MRAGPSTCYTFCMTKTTKAQRITTGDAVRYTRPNSLGVGVVVDFVDGRRNQVLVQWENKSTFAVYTKSLQTV